MSYRILTDNCCDYPAGMYEDLNLTAIPLSVRFQGKEVTQYNEKWLKKMYAGLYDELEKVRNMLLIQHNINQKQTTEVYKSKHAQDTNLHHRVPLFR